MSDCLLCVHPWAKWSVPLHSPRPAAGHRSGDVGRAAVVRSSKEALEY